LQGKVDLIFDKEDGSKMEFARSIDGDVSGVYMEEFGVLSTPTNDFSVFKWDKYRFHLDINDKGIIKSVRKEI
ncbi:MAG: hypothetical protein IPJ01_11840, partial [Micavibrio sp.]|nr:hypothetical protein [Micavibrio sp.]